MLFDLRGRGRRRTVQGIYLGLALLMGGGLVLFGVGGTGVGLFNNDNNKSGGGTNVVSKQLAAAERTVRLRPRDAAAWGQLAYQRYLASRNGSGSYNQDTQTYTPKGRAELRRAEQAWDRYVALHPRRPDSSVTTNMAVAFGPTGLNEPKKVVEAYELATQGDARNYLPYFQLAQAAYSAKQTRKGDLAAERAVALASKDQRAGIRAALAQSKKGPATTSSPTPTPVPSG